MLERFGLTASDCAPPNSRWGLIEIRRYGFRNTIWSEGSLSGYKGAAR